MSFDRSESLDTAESTSQTVSVFGPAKYSSAVVRRIAGPFLELASKGPIDGAEGMGIQYNICEAVNKLHRSCSGYIVRFANGIDIFDSLCFLIVNVILYCHLYSPKRAYGSNPVAGEPEEEETEESSRARIVVDDEVLDLIIHYVSRTDKMNVEMVSLFNAFILGIPTQSPHLIFTISLGKVQELTDAVTGKYGSFEFDAVQHENVLQFLEEFQERCKSLPYFR